MQYSLIDLETVLRLIGRGTVWYAHDGDDVTVGDPIMWDGASQLHLAQLGDTEGDIVINPQGTVSTLTLPETRGDAILEAVVTGENPQIEVPLFLADPDLLPILSPTGRASAGHSRVRDVAGRTIVVFPERMFRKVDQTYAAVAYTTGGGWTLDAVAFDAAHLTLLGHSVWFWNCYVDRPTRSFRGGHGDDGKNIESCIFHAMVHPDMPEGEQLYTIGNPITAGIDIAGGS